MVSTPSFFFKLNTDVAFMERSHSGGWGAIARDQRGEIIFAADGYAHHLSGALHAETMAVQIGLCIADQMGTGRMIISTDSQVLKNAIETPSLDHARLGQLSLDIKFQLAMEFIDYTVEYCPRECNKPAHVLAAMGMGMDQNNQSMWLSGFQMMYLVLWPAI